MESESSAKSELDPCQEKSWELDICKVLDVMEDKPETLLFITHLGYLLAINLDPNFRTKITVSTDEHLHIFQYTEILLGPRRMNLT